MPHDHPHEPRPDTPDHLTYYQTMEVAFRELLIEKGIVPLVIMTHETTEGAAARACAAIDKLKPVRGETVRMWVRD